MDKLILNQLNAITNSFSRDMSLYGKWAKKHGLHYNSLMVLYAMEDTKNCTQKYICKKWMLPKTTVSTILSEFHKQGYIIFLSDDTDKRGKIIQLTEKGEQFSLSVLTKLHELEIRTMKKMGPSLCKQLVEANTLFTKIFEQEVEND